jgi:hypothetical protein
MLFHMKPHYKKQPDAIRACTEPQKSKYGSISQHFQQEFIKCHLNYMFLWYISHKLYCFTSQKIKLYLSLTNSALHNDGIWGSGCTDTHFLGLDTSWWRVVSLMPTDTHYIRGPQSRSRWCWELNLLDPTRARTLACWSYSM